MKQDKNKRPKVSDSTKQTALPTKKQFGVPEHKHQPPIKTPATDGRKNTVEENNELNQSRTNRQDQLPSDE